MYKIMKLNKIDKQGLSVFPIDEYEIGEKVSSPDAILLRSFKMHDMQLPDSLLAVGRAGAGVNNIPIEKCSEKGVVVFNTPGANANAVKELAIAGLLLVSRDIVKGVNFSESLKGKGAEVSKEVEGNKKHYAGQEIQGKTLGIVGLGKIGVMVANSAVDLGMRVIGYDPFISVESAWGLSRSVERAHSFDEFLGKCDYLSLHTPLNENTNGIIDAEKLSNMKEGVRILNLSRGEIVNTHDIIEAINRGIVARYITDFPNDELLGQENVIAVPHLGASTNEAESNCAVMVANQIRDFLERGNIVNSVNYPQCKLEQSADYRLLVMNKNVPNMVGQISTILAESNINIVEMINKSKGDFACNIIDISQEPTEALVSAISKIQGIVKVRAITLKK